MAKKPEKFRQSSARILLVSGENVEARRILNVFIDHGLNAFCVNTVAEAKKTIRDWKPQVVVTNLLIQGGSAYEILDYINNNAKGTASIILSSHNHERNLDEAMRRGASDYLKRPFSFDDLLNRVVIQCRQTNLVKDSWNDPEEMGINGLLSCSMSPEGIDQVTHEITKRLAKSTNSVRCSLIRAITTSEGLVFASHDDPHISGLRIDLSTYPEVQVVANTKKMIAINDLEESKALSHIRGKAKSIDFSAMIVAPVFYKGRFFGVLSVRLPKSTKEVPQEAIRMTSITAKVISLALSARATEELGRFGLISAS